MDPAALLISYILKQVTEYPEDVSINQSVDERGILLKVSVNPADLGRVIGAKGQTAQALRTLLRAMGNKYDARYNLKIMEDNE